MGRCQLHAIPAPWSIGIGCRTLLHVRKTYKSVEGGRYGVYDGGILLARLEKGSWGHFLHVVVGKGETPTRRKAFADFHE